MTDRFVKALDRVLDLDLAELDEDDTEALETLRRMFQPQTGITLAPNQTMQDAHCEACGFDFPVGSTPMDASAWATMAQRHAQCPRCACTTRIVLKGSRP